MEPSKLITILYIYMYLWHYLCVRKEMQKKKIKYIYIYIYKYIVQTVWDNSILIYTLNILNISKVYINLLHTYF